MAELRLGASSMSIIWELVRNPEFLGPSRNYWIRVCIFTRSLRDWVTGTVVWEAQVQNMSPELSKSSNFGDTVKPVFQSSNLHSSNNCQKVALQDHHLWHLRVSFFCHNGRLKRHCFWFSFHCFLKKLSFHMLIIFFLSNKYLFKSFNISFPYLLLDPPSIKSSIFIYQF